MARLATGALAAAAAGWAAQDAEASVIFFNTPVTLENGDTWFLDGSTRAAGNVDIITSVGYFPEVRQNSFAFAASTNLYIKKLNDGDLVNALAFAAALGTKVSWFTVNTVDPDNAGGAFANFTKGEAALAGFRFSPDGGTTTLFGWLQFTINTGNAGIIIHQWAYEDSGSQIEVDPQAVPEPSTTALAGLGVLALGIVGMRSYQKRRAAA